MKLVDNRYSSGTSTVTVRVEIRNSNNTSQVVTDSCSLMSTVDNLE